MTCTVDNLKGILTALATPFNSDGSGIDYDSLHRLLEFQVSHKVDGVVVCGSTGEAATLSEEEYKKVVLTVRDFMRGKGICIAGVGSSDTKKAVGTTKFLSEEKLDGILLVTPPYNKPPQKGLVEHFRHVKEASSIPIVGYNVPGRTGVNLLPDTVHELVSKRYIVGLKESSGSIDQFLDTVSKVGESISLLTGDCSMILSTMVAGGRGAISATANIIPDLLVSISSNALAGRWKEAREAQLRALPIIRMAFSETNPIPIKAALYHRKIIKYPTLRLPLIEASKATRDLIEKVLPL